MKVNWTVEEYKLIQHALKLQLEKVQTIYMDLQQSRLDDRKMEDAFNKGREIDRLLSKIYKKGGK